MRALVTGGVGFLGSRIADLLCERGDCVTVTSRDPRRTHSNAAVRTVIVDLADAAGVAAVVRDVDVVFHTAARTGVWGPRAIYVQANIHATRNVIEACRQNGVGRLVYTSTPSVVFGGHDLCGVNESQPYPSRFLCHYAATKAAAERMVLAAGGRELATVALRPHLIYGPGDPHLLPRVIERARRGRLRQVGDGENLVDLTYIDNAAHAHLDAADRLCATGLCATGSLGATGGLPASVTGTGAPGGLPASAANPGATGTGATGGLPASGGCLPASARADKPPVAHCGGKAYFISDGEPVKLWPWINALLARLALPPAKPAVSLRTAYTAGGLMEALYAALRIRAEPPMTRFLALQLAQSHYFDISAARRDLGYAPRISPDEGLERWEQWHRTHA